VHTEEDSDMIAKTCGCKDTKRKVTYSFVDSYHSLCKDKKDIILSEVQACEILLKYPRDEMKSQIARQHGCADCLKFSFPQRSNSTDVSGITNVLESFLDQLEKVQSLSASLSMQKTIKNIWPEFEQMVKSFRFVD
jgi:hypothetical protein